MYNLTLWLARLILHHLGCSNSLLLFQLIICRQCHRVLRTMCEPNPTVCLLVLQTSMSRVTKETQQCFLFSIIEIKNRVVHTPWTVLESLYHFARRKCLYFDLMSQTTMPSTYSYKAPNSFPRI